MRGESRKELGGSPQGLARDNKTSMGNASMAAARSRARSKEITMRKQVGDMESMMNEEGEGKAKDSFAQEL